VGGGEESYLLINQGRKCFPRMKGTWQEGQSVQTKKAAKYCKRENKKRTNTKQREGLRRGRAGQNPRGTHLMKEEKEKPGG